MLTNALVEALFLVLARYNGYNGKYTIAKTNNNPGLIVKKKGYNRQLGYIYFPSPEIGEKIFKRELQKKIRENWTIYQVAKRNKNAAMDIIRLLARRRVKAEIHTRLSSLINDV